MRIAIFASSLVVIPSLFNLSFAGNASKPDCVSFTEASRHLGMYQCVSGTVLHVESGRNGTKFLSFCQDSGSCPFRVVVFPGDVKKLGNIVQLEGRQIEIRGTVQNYEGRSEIVLRRPQQLGDAAFCLFPPVPTDYDVERTPHNSAGSFRHPKRPKKSVVKQGSALSIEDPEEPQ